jgi:hypothetical protein
VPDLVRTDEMHRSNPPDHALHDLDLVAASIDGDLADHQRAAADALVATCTSCAELRRDLVALAAATRALPRSATARRDFRLDAQQAARLRRGGLLRRLLRPLAAPGSAARPMAAAFTTLGLAGLLVANILPSLFGGAASGVPTGAGSGGARLDNLAAASNAPVAAPVAGQGPAATGSGGAGYQAAPGPTTSRARPSTPPRTRRGTRPTRARARPAGRRPPPCPPTSHSPSQTSC